MKRLALVALAIASGWLIESRADSIAAFAVGIQKGGVFQGAVPTLNTGSGVTVAISGGVATFSATGSFTNAPPYFTDGTNFFVASTGYKATKPTSTPSWINSVTPPSAAAGPNGDYVFSGTGTYWATQSATTSVEGVIATAGIATSASGQSGIWLWDSGNGIIWFMGPGFTNTNPGVPELVILKYTYAGTGNPLFSAATTFTGYASMTHMKIVKVGSNANFQISLNGGQSFTTLTSNAVSTISSGGFGGSQSLTDVVSLVLI
jgi:hypothetical protein